MRSSYDRQRGRTIQPSGDDEWRKLGLVLAAAGGSAGRTHAMLPTPRITSDAIRVLFASCDERLRGRVFSVALDRAAPIRVLHLPEAPILDLGEPGAFDADGVNPSQLVERDGALFLYYIGWKRHSAAVPYTLFAGLAVSDDNGGSFRRWSPRPILAPCSGEEYFRTAPYVYRVGARWEMLYIGGDRFFTAPNGKRLPVYALRRTTSDDGLVWEAPGEELLAPDPSRREIGFGRPWLWHDQHGQPALMLSVRTRRGYTLVQLENTAAGAHRRPVLARSVAGWDSDMTCFGAPCRDEDREFLFYNGNRFGRTGFGVATRRAVFGKEDGIDRDLDPPRVKHLIQTVRP